MPLNLESIFKLDIGSVLEYSNVIDLAIMSDDSLGSGPLIRSILNQLLEELDVESLSLIHI